jgi:chromosome segregation ATPase
MTTIHPDSKLGQLQAAVDAARAAHQAATDELATLATEAGDLDRWIEAAGLDTAPLDFAKKQARRAILANVMARTREELKAHSQSLAQLQKQYAPQQDRALELSRELVALEDQTNPYTRQLSLRDLDRRLSEIRGWLNAWTEPEAAAVDALEPVEA